jgi:iron(III) transport system permease protein
MMNDEREKQGRVVIPRIPRPPFLIPCSSFVIHHSSCIMSSAARWVAPLTFAAFILLPLAAYSIEFLRHPVEPLAKTFASLDESLRLARVFGHSVAVAAAGATLSLLLGMLTFVGFMAAPRRVRVWLWGTAALPLMVPPHFVAIGWIQAVGNAGWFTALLRSVGTLDALPPSILYSSFGCAAVLALHCYPIALAILWIAHRTPGAAAVESGTLLMPPARLWKHLLLGWMKPWLAIAWLVTFIPSLLEYSIPAMLRHHVFPVEIMTAYSVYYDPPRALGLSIPLVAMSLLAAALLGRFLRRVEWPVFTRQSLEWPPLPRVAAASLLVGAGGVALLAVCVPIGTFLGWAGGWSTYEVILRSSSAQAQASVVWSLAAATTVVFLAAGLALWGQGGGRARVTSGWIFPLMLALFALPGSVAAMAHIAFWNRESCFGITQAVYDSGFMLPLGAVTLLLPVAYVILWVRLRQTPPALLDLERLDGNPSLRRRWLLTLPRLARPAGMAAMLVFVLAIQELPSALLLAAPGQETLSVRAFTLLHYAPDRVVAAFCLISLGALAVGLIGIGLAWVTLGFLARKGLPFCAFD